MELGKLFNCYDARSRLINSCAIFPELLSELLLIYTALTLVDYCTYDIFLLAPTHQIDWLIISLKYTASQIELVG